MKLFSGFFHIRELRLALTIPFQSEDPFHVLSRAEKARQKGHLSSYCWSARLRLPSQTEVKCVSAADINKSTMRALNFLPPVLLLPLI